MLTARPKWIVTLAVVAAGLALSGQVEQFPLNWQPAKTGTDGSRASCVEQSVENQFVENGKGKLGVAVRNTCPGPMNVAVAAKIAGSGAARWELAGSVVVGPRQTQRFLMAYPARSDERFDGYHALAWAKPADKPDVRGCVAKGAAAPCPAVFPAPPLTAKLAALHRTQAPPAPAPIQAAAKPGRPDAATIARLTPAQPPASQPTGLLTSAAIWQAVVDKYVTDGAVLMTDGTLRQSGKTFLPRIVRHFGCTAVTKTTAECSFTLKTALSDAAPATNPTDKILEAASLMNAMSTVRFQKLPGGGWKALPPEVPQYDDDYEEEEIITKACVPECYPLPAGGTYCTCI